MLENKNIEKTRFIKRWWFWLIAIFIIVISLPNNNNVQNSHIYENTSSNFTNDILTNKNENIIFDNNLNNINPSNKSNEDIVYFDTYPSFIDDCTKKNISNYSFLNGAYNISTIGNSVIKIYVYNNKYYDISTYTNNSITYCFDLLLEISKKEYKKKYFAPSSVIINIVFCGYGKDLYTKNINNNTQPLASLTITTEDLKNNINIEDYIKNNIKIEKDWF